MPFDNLSGDHADDTLAAAISDDLATELSEIPGATVVSRTSAKNASSRAPEVSAIGRELGVRYLLQGSVRRQSADLRVNVQLISTDSGTNVWSDRFTEPITAAGGEQEQIARRLFDGLNKGLIDVENARSLRERASNPDAFDLELRGRSLQHLPPSPDHDREALDLYERALALDPTSVFAMTRIGYFLVDYSFDQSGGWHSFDQMIRAGRLLQRAHAIAPNSLEATSNYAYWLVRNNRCPEVIEIAEQIIKLKALQSRSYTGLYSHLSVCKLTMGNADAAIAVQDTALRNNPGDAFTYNRYRRMTFAALLQGRDKEAIEFAHKSLNLNPEVAGAGGSLYRNLAAAYAFEGQLDEAKHWLSKADAVWRFDTARGHDPDESSSLIHAQQIRRYQQGLRLAGERDHAEEDADFGIPTDGVLHNDLAGYTPKEADGVRSIRTPELASVVDKSPPLIIDTMTYTWRQSLPGAVGLKYSGLGGSFSDDGQSRLRTKMRGLTGGNLSAPIVAVGWNSERFDGRNLALRLVALGYKNVYWYRGGREAWEVAGLPETKLDVQEW
jgi:adenylate cyclase